MDHRTRYIILAVLAVVVVAVYLLVPAGEDELRRRRNQVSYGRVFQHPMPQWSGDGEVIAFTHDQAVYAVESDGSQLRRLLGSRPDDLYDAAQSPSFSPDGSRVAYVAFKHGSWVPWVKEDYRWDIVTAALDGSGRRRLTKSDNILVRYVSPAWSPDGTRIAFVSDRTGHKDSESGKEANGPLAFYTMSADGSDLRRVAPGNRIAADSPPVWSPDGRMLAFIARERESPDSSLRVLYTVGADGLSPTRLGETGRGLPGWSPDGSRIAFVRVDGDAQAVVTMDPDGSNVTEVLEHRDLFTSSFGDVSWSPDGTRILIPGLLVPNAGASVSVVNADGSDPRHLLTMPYGATLGLAVSWSPDGTRIAVHSRDPRFTDGALITMAHDGSDRRILVKHTRNSRVFAAGHGAPISWGSPSYEELERIWHEWRLRQAIKPEETGWESWRQWPQWPVVSAQGLRKTRQGEMFDVSAVDVTNLPQMDCVLVYSTFSCDLRKRFPDEGIGEVYYTGTRTVYLQMKDPPTDQAELKALKDRLFPCHDVIGLCRYQVAEGFSRIADNPSTTTIEIFPIPPMKYDPGDLWRWATILDRFAASPGNTIEMTGAEVAVHVRREGVVYLNRPSRAEDFGFETAPKTIRVKGRELRRLVVALPLLLPQLGIPVDAVGLVKPCPRRGYCY